MGEYARLNGTSIKIGTCESMYYLRADQARLVTPQPGSVNPVRDAEHIRFRFPFPDEDSIAPGAFEDYGRRIRLDGMAPPPELAGEHYSVQFVNQTLGYNLSIPCPESVPDSPGFHVEMPGGLRVHRNGFAGAVFLSQQVLHEGRALVPVLCCACGMAWRLPTLEDAADLLTALEGMDKRERASYVDPLPEDFQTRAQKIAERVRQGYDPAHVAELFPGAALEAQA